MPAAPSRSDGRSPSDLRPTRFDWDPMGFALSSVTVHTGRTAVICSVCLEEGVPKWRQGSGKGWLSADYRLLPASTPSRQPRELMKLSGRTQEIQRLIARSLRACLDLEALGERSLHIDCDVLQADAGTRTASITGAWAALALGLVGSQALLDLDYSEDSRAEVDLNVVMNSQGQLLEVQGTAEGAPFSRQQLNQLLDLADEGLQLLRHSQLQALEQAPK
jgi:ribonuclease PH